MRSLILASVASLAYRNVNAHPSGFSTSERMLSRRAVNLDSFRMKLETEYKDAVSVQADPDINSIEALLPQDPKETATALVKTSFPEATFRLVDDSYVGTNGIAHYNFKQTANGLDIENADFNVNIGRDGNVFSYGSSFYKGSAPSKLRKRDNIRPVDAFNNVINQLQLPITTKGASAEETSENTFAIKNSGGTVSDPEVRLAYFQVDGKISLSWRVETNIDTNWLVTYVDAQTGEKVYHVHDYSSDASYEVYPWGINDPTEGQRIVITDPFDPVASEFGWHSDGAQTYNTTWGNNGVAQSNWNNRPTSELLAQPRPSPPDLKFEYPYSTNETDWTKYINASITQLYYTSNTYHDLLYKLGFTEAAFNFETNNNGQGGVGNDFVYLNAQDGAGLNNANFLTPPDGQRARMRMYLWDRTTPRRDGAFDAGIVIHEYTHGVSNRLTGGTGNAACLGIVEAGGMGEGWGDLMSLAIRLKPNDNRNTNYAVGSWATGTPLGVRAYYYSTSQTTNPLTYANVDGNNAVHSIGTVWATILYEVLWNLIDKHGKNDGPVPEFDENGVPTDGKFLLMKLVIDGLALQPCNPTFISARDAIIDADRALTGGENACELWTGFAKRGLGDGAKYSTSKRTLSFTLPAGVC